MVNDQCICVAWSEIWMRAAKTEDMGLKAHTVWHRWLYKVKDVTWMSFKMGGESGSKITGFNWDNKVRRVRDILTFLHQRLSHVKHIILLYKVYTLAFNEVYILAFNAEN